MDKMMVKYTKKYSHIRQYMKAKPYQYGVKIWCFANVKYKFVQKMEVYYGASHEDVKHATWYKIIIRYDYK